MSAANHASSKPVSSMTVGERAAWEPLWKGYLDFYEVDGAEGGLRHHLGAAAGSRGADVSARRLCRRQAASASSTIIYHRSCWTIGDYCYLQDLFVGETRASSGSAARLIEAVYKAARQRREPRHWLTHETNATARALYDTLAERPASSSIAKSASGAAQPDREVPRTVRPRLPRCCASPLIGRKAIGLKCSTGI